VLLFQRDHFAPADAAQTALTTRCLLVGLPFLGLAQLYARAFYALGDTAAPARIAAVLLVVNASTNLVLVLGFGFGTEGLAAATSGGAMLNTLLLALQLRKHVPRDPGAGTDSWLRTVAATSAMAVAVVAVQPELTGGRGELLLWRVAMPIVVGVAVYFATHRLMRSPELSQVRWRRRS